MRVVVGSRNPVKLAAVQDVLAAVFPELAVVGVAVSGGVREQPWGDDETRRGALMRAHTALSQQAADFAVGLEGGLVETPVGLMTCAWAAMINPAGQVGYGGGVRMLLPPSVVTLVHELGELGPAMDALIAEHNTKQNQGAVGILSAGLSNRRQAYAQLVAMAAAPFVTDFYA